MGMSMKFARIWLIGLPMIVALLGFGLSIRPLLTDPGTEGEDWSLVVGGVMVVMAILALVTSLPGFILLRDAQSARSSTRTRLGACLLTIPVLAVAAPLSSTLKSVFILGAVAGAPTLVMIAVQSIRRRRVGI